MNLRDKLGKHDSGPLKTMSLAMLIAYGKEECNRMGRSEGMTGTRGHHTCTPCPQFSEPLQDLLQTPLKPHVMWLPLTPERVQVLWFGYVYHCQNSYYNFQWKEVSFSREGGHFSKSWFLRSSSAPHTLPFPQEPHAFSLSATS